MGYTEKYDQKRNTAERDISGAYLVSPPPRQIVVTVKQKAISKNAFNDSTQSAEPAGRPPCERSSRSCWWFLQRSSSRRSKIFSGGRVTGNPTGGVRRRGHEKQSLSAHAGGGGGRGGACSNQYSIPSAARAVENKTMTTHKTATIAVLYLPLFPNPNPKINSRQDSFAVVFSPTVPSFQRRQKHLQMSLASQGTKQTLFPQR